MGQYFAVWVLGPAFSDYGETVTRRPRYVTLHRGSLEAQLAAGGIHRVFGCPTWIEEWDGTEPTARRAHVWPKHRLGSAA